MAEGILALSVLIQALAVVQAVRLALRHRRVGWVFLALANTLMLVRRVLSLTTAVSAGHPADPVVECVAVVISLLMMIGLTLLPSWLRPAGESAETADAIRHGAIRRLRRQAVLLALLSLFGCAVLSYFAYTATRDVVTDRLLKGSLDLAHMLAAAVDAAPDNAAATRELEHLWSLAPSQYRDNYLCVIGADGKLLVNSRKPEKVGVFVGGTAIPAGENAPRTVQELVKAGGDWVGRNRNSEGEPQIAAYAYSAKLGALVAVHLPSASVDGEIHAAALPWALGIGMLFIVVLPFSFALLYFVGMSSQEAAFQALERKAESEHRYALLVENVKDHAIFLLDPQGRVTTWNPGAESIRGWTEEEILGRNISSFYTEEDAVRRLPEQDLAAAADAGRLETEGWRVRHDGSRFWASVTISCLRNGADEPRRGYLVVTRDISESRQAREALHESEERLRILTDNADVGLVLIDAEHRYVFANTAYAKVLGMPVAAIGGMRVADVLPDVYEERIRPRLDRALAGERVVYDLRLPGERGGRFVAVKYDPVRADGVVVRVAVVVVDVTEQKQAEERVRQLNRTYAVLSGINELIVRERDPLKMLNDGCRIAVAVGDFRMAWIGLADETGEVRSVTAHGGASEDTLEKLREILNGPEGRCGCTFTDRALKTGTHAICNDIENDPEAEPWRDAALRRDYQSMASLPLKVDGKIAGTFNLYATEAGYFGAEEMRLLDELALDIGFALEVSRRETERRSVEEEVRTQLDELLRWQGVMLAREDRVHELKAEVNELLAGQGQPARYSSQEKA